MTETNMLQNLTAKEMAIIDIRMAANFLIDRTLTLSQAVNTEILIPISEWIDDPDFLKKYASVLEDKIDWAKLTRNQR